MSSQYATSSDDSLVSLLPAPPCIVQRLHQPNTPSNHPSPPTTSSDFLSAFLPIYSNPPDSRPSPRTSAEHLEHLTYLRDIITRELHATSLPHVHTPPYRRFELECSAARLDALELELLRIEMKRLRENLVAVDADNERLQDEGQGRGRWGGGPSHHLRGDNGWPHAPAPASCDGWDADVSSYASSEGDSSYVPVPSGYASWEMDAAGGFEREGEEGLRDPPFCRRCGLPKLCTRRGHVDRGCGWGCLAYACSC